MASNPKLNVTVANSMLTVLTALLNNGFIKFYDGAQPVSASTGVTTQNLLATMTFQASAFNAPSGGSAVANAINPVSIVYTSTCTWARLYQSDGVTVVCDLGVGLSGSDINFSTVSFVSGVNVVLNSLTLTQSPT
jgi:hypothetical protein